MYYDRGMAHFVPGKDVPIMDVQTLLAQLPPEQPDIFLCTRELPDKLTAETAALRQLCSALAGDGYKVFFPSGLPRDLTDEQRAAKIVEALKGSKIKTIQVKVARKKSVNKKYVKKYKKIFTKKNAGRKVAVK